MKCGHGFRDHSQDGELVRLGLGRAQNGAHIMLRKGCAMQNQGITLSYPIEFFLHIQSFHHFLQLDQHEMMSTSDK